MAEQDNPPLEPFPEDHNGVCKISIKPGESFNGRSGTSHVMSPNRNIEFIFQGLNDALCSRIVDFIKSEEIDSENSTRTTNLDVGKTFLIISFVVVAALTLLGIAFAASQSANCRRPISSAFFRAPNEQKKEERRASMEHAV